MQYNPKAYSAVYNSQERIEHRYISTPFAKKKINQPRNVISGLLQTNEIGLLLSRFDTMLIYLMKL